MMAVTWGKKKKKKQRKGFFRRQAPGPPHGHAPFEFSPVARLGQRLDLDPVKSRRRKREREKE